MRQRGGIPIHGRSVESESPAEERRQSVRSSASSSSVQGGSAGVHSRRKPGPSPRAAAAARESGTELGASRITGDELLGRQASRRARDGHAGKPSRRFEQLTRIGRRRRLGSVSWSGLGSSTSRGRAPARRAEPRSGAWQLRREAAAPGRRRSPAVERRPPRGSSARDRGTSMRRQRPAPARPPSGPVAIDIRFLDRAELPFLVRTDGFAEAA